MTKRSHALHVFTVIVTTVGAILAPALLPGGVLAKYAWAAPLGMGLAYFVNWLRGRDIPPPTGAVVVLLAVALASGGATCRQPGPVPPADGGTLTDCADAALHNAEVTIIPRVENALALADYASVTAALGSIVASLAVSVGAPLALAEVTCVVDWVVSKAEQQHAQTADTLEASKAAFGARWVAEHGANVKPAGSL